MSRKIRLVLAVCLVSATPAILSAQFPSQSDTAIVFQPSDPQLVRPNSFRPNINAWGLDLLVSNNGFGLGTFYRHEFSDEFSGVLSFMISDVKDDAEIERYTYYGDSYVLGKKNRLLMLPLIAGVQYRLFKDEIMDNFRPYITAGLGPTMIFVAPYARYSDAGTGTQQQQVEFFSSLKYGQARYTLGGYVGAGAYFGLDKGTISGISLRYYFAPFPEGIEVMYGGGYMKNFGGVYISLHFGSFL